MAEKDPQKKSIDDMLQAEAIKKFGLSGVMEKIDKVMPLLEQVAAGAEVLKGQDGKTPVLGEDYLNEDEQKAAIEMVRPRKGVDYNDGKDGEDGYTPQRGIDYLTDSEMADIVSQATPKKGTDYFTADEIAGMKAEVTPKKGVDYKDGENPTPAQFIEVVKSLKGKEAAAFSEAVGAKIDISHVRNAGSFIFNGKKYDTSELMHGGGSGGGSSIELQTDGVDNGSQVLLNLVAGTNITLTNNGGDVTIDATGGSGGTPGGLNTQVQYNNNGAFGGITGAVTDGTAMSLTAAHLLNPTINGAGVGLATLVYPNTVSNATITVPATTGTLALTSDLTGFVTSVTGTSNRITSTGGTTPAIDISASYVGQSSITTLGTITTGVWHGTTIAVGNGGTGVTTIAAKSIWVANALDTITSVTPGAGQSIRINAGNTAWEAYTPTTGTVTSVTGTSARITSTGGATPVIDIDAAYVGQSSIITLGTVTTGTWSATTVALNKGGTGQTTKAAAFDALSPMSASGDIIYGGTAGTGTRLAKGSDTQILTLVSGLPAWTAPATAGTVTSVSGTSNRITSTGGTTPVIDISASYVGQTSITTLGTITTGTWTGTTIAIANGGTGATSLAGASIPTYTSTVTLTNKRITRRLVTVNAPGATPTTNTDNVDVQNFTGLATAITSMTTNLSGTPVDGDMVEFRFTDNGTARAITWGASFGSTTVTLPTTTVISTMLRVGFEWNGSIWQCIAVA